MDENNTTEIKRFILYHSLNVYKIIEKKFLSAKIIIGLQLLPYTYHVDLTTTCIYRLPQVFCGVLHKWNHVCKTSKCNRKLFPNLQPNKLNLLKQDLVC